jgi:hypothetical protein
MYQEASGWQRTSVSRAASERGKSAQSKVPFCKKANTGKMAELGGFTAILRLVATLAKNHNGGANG